ncbi:hypothetical protein HFN69_09355 [Rhizobium laguerreae]|uniref:hypothetical protein n=1 Tax=Rhizobium laguerreae TaxID=1076926 RepID=UPI001C9169C3|nr:hypothetical protein [Rhizobium laguerreae]MBY3296989.1 hypothetical protein [Rhizobium laguerreae]MBY3546810.1 hypothetical protein [Rhizobium laguerreae]
MTESPHIVIPVVQRDKANAGFRDFVEEAIDNPPLCAGIASISLINAFSVAALAS